MAALPPITCPNHLHGARSANHGYFLISVDDKANLSPRKCQHARAAAGFAALASGSAQEETRFSHQATDIEENISMQKSLYTQLHTQN